jgi:hypothetical protein
VVRKAGRPALIAAWDEPVRKAAMTAAGESGLDA